MGNMGWGGGSVIGFNNWMQTQPVFNAGAKPTQPILNSLLKQAASNYNPNVVQNQQNFNQGYGSNWGYGYGGQTPSLLPPIFNPGPVQTAPGYAYGGQTLPSIFNPGPVQTTPGYGLNSRNPIYNPGPAQTRPNSGLGSGYGSNSGHAMDFGYGFNSGGGTFGSHYGLPNNYYDPYGQNSVGCLQSQCMNGGVIF